MSENQSAPVEQNQSSGQTDGDEVLSKSPDTVQYDTYRKVLGEKKKTQEHAKALADENQSLLLKLKEIEERELTEKENWKTLFEKRNQELEDLKSQLSGERENRSRMIKYSALLKALPGDVKESYWSLLPIDQIELSDEGVDEVSVKKAAEFIMNQMPEIVTMAKKGPDLPSKAPTSAAQNGASRAELLQKFVKLTTG